MAPKFQNRLVGLVILVSLGVIVLPDMLDGKKEHYQGNFPAIPLQEPVPEKLVQAPIELPESVDDVALPTVIETKVMTDNRIAAVEVEKGEPLKQEEQVEEQTVEQEVASLPSAGMSDSAWIIRLGTFRNHENATALVEKLRTEGYPAQLMPRNFQVGDLVRVEVGPDVSEETIVAMRSKLEESTGLKGQVIRFNPLIP